jgi:RNA-binding protein
MPLSSKDRAALRGEAHHLSAAVHVGQHGLTDTVRQTLDDTLRTRELVKVQFGKNAGGRVKDAADELARSVNAEVVQVIGKTVTLYRENPDLERKDEPAWRRH